jgi:hypothetical protein
MGSPAAIGLILLVLLVIGGFAFLIGALTKSSAAGHVDPAEAAEAEHNLHYLVPHGQDPAVLRAALHEAGYDSASEALPEGDVLTIVLHDGTTADVERVRQVLTDTHDTTLSDPAQAGPVQVRFREKIH